ncbi:MAG: acetate--CoA ligase family protein [Nitrososphaerota archaeon]
MGELDAFFNPRSIAVIGVSRHPDKVGRVIYDRLLNNRRLGILKAEIYPINPELRELYGHRVFAGLSEINEKVDLVVIALPASQVPQAILEAGQNGVKAAIVVSGGFSELGNDQLTESLRRAIKQSGVRVLGPNTVGVMDSYTGVNTFFTREVKAFSDGRTAQSFIFPSKGNISVVSQSGALAHYILDTLGERGVGVRAVACVGNQIDVSIPELLSYFANDALTSVVAIYIEGIRGGRELLNRFLELRRKGKQIVVLKAGRTLAGKRTAYTHTASMAGEWETYVGAFKQAGAVVVDNVKELAEVSLALSLQKPPRGKRLAILTNAGGFSVIASDLAQANGLEVIQLPKDSIEKMERLKRDGKIPPVAVVTNPVDLSGSADSAAFEEAYRIVSECGVFDMHLLMPFHVPPMMDERVVYKLAEIARASDAVVVGCDTGNTEWSVAMRALTIKNGIPAYKDMEDAIRVLTLIANIFTPSRESFPVHDAGSSEVSEPIPRADLLELVSKHGIQVAREEVVFTEDEAVEAAESIGYPVVMKIASEKIAHKTDVGGVLLGITDRAQVLEAFKKLMQVAEKLEVRGSGVIVQETAHGIELILGSKVDETFGPTVLVGMGGVFTEVVRDFITFVSPVQGDEADEMLNRLRLSKLLDGFRGYPPVDRKALRETIVNFSQILIENPSIAQLEINPLMAYGERIVAVDIRGWRYSLR